MKKTRKRVKDESFALTRRVESLELESYMEAFSDFMESPVKIEDPGEIKHWLASMIRRWKRLSNDDKFRTFGYTLGVAKYLSLHTTTDFRKALREFSVLVYDTR